jgi:uncharacterized protein
MIQIKWLWQYIVVKPFSWLFYFVFQPTKFRRECKGETVIERLIQMLKLVLPLFLCCYPLAIIVRILLHNSLPYFYDNFFYKGASTIDGFFLFETMRGVLWGIMGSVIGGVIFGTTIGLAFGLTDGLVGGVVVDATTNMAQGELIGLVFTIISILVLSTLLGLSVNTQQGAKSDYFISGFTGILVGLVIGTVVGLIVGYFVGLLIGSLHGGSIPEGETSGKIGSLFGGLLSSIAVDFLGGIARRSIARNTGPAVKGALEISRTVSIAFGAILGTTSGTIGTLGAAKHLVTQGITLNIAVGAEVSLIGGTLFFVFYLLSYYRIPLYPIAAFSLINVYFVGKTGRKVFDALHRSALYWDERVFLPLPFLERILLLATKMDREETLQEIHFIVHERPSQLPSALLVISEIVLKDLEQCTTMDAIANALDKLVSILPQEAELINPQWLAPFKHLTDTSREAVRFCSHQEWHARYIALEDMQNSLHEVSLNTASQGISLGVSIDDIVSLWREVVQRELTLLEQIEEKTKRIRNPYKPGIQLALNDSLFVGRRDLAQQLEEMIINAGHPPSFLLNGERRIGKSSTLRQLPSLLGARYIPVFYDLQRSGIAASASIFLGNVAEGIAQTLDARKLGTKIRRLSDEKLQEASYKNEAMVYHVFEEWLMDLEQILEQEDRILILTFDEFEELEGSFQRGDLNTELLLNWFRYLMQNYHQIVLLFSSLHTFDEMGIHWVSHFVNVQSIKVGLLRVEEARQLIMQRRPDFPSEEIFDDAIIDEVLYKTGCHPFLLQAVGSVLIEILNEDKRRHTTFQDIDTAVEQVLVRWSSHFSDLWERTDAKQRKVLTFLKQAGSAQLPSIEAHCHNQIEALPRVIEVLLRRDLIVCENGNYQIGAPLITKWIENKSNM